MAEISADTSSYPKPPAPVNMLDQMQKWGALDQQKLQIEAGKLELVQKQLGAMSSELSNMLDTPNMTKDQAVQQLNSFADTTKMPPEVRQKMLNELHQSPDVSSFARKNLLRAMDTQQRIDATLGRTSLINRGPDQVPAVVKTGKAPQQIGLPIAVGTSPETSGSPTPIYNPQTGTYSQGTRGQYESNAGVPPLPVDMYGAPNRQQQAAQPQRQPPAAPPVDAQQSIAQLNKERQEGTVTMDRMKPVAQAIPLIETGIKTGVGTPQFYKAVSALTNLGWITDNDKNPAVIISKINKKLEQLARESGTRSDADLAAAVRSNPNPNSQLNTALLDLTKDAVSQAYMKSARALTYDGPDDQYTTRSSRVAASQNPEAYRLLLESPEKRRAIFTDMMAKAEAGDKRAQAFIRSYNNAIKLNAYSGPVK